METLPHYVRLGRALAMLSLGAAPGCLSEARAQTPPSSPPMPPCPAQQPASGTDCPQLGQRCTYYEPGRRPPPETACVCATVASTRYGWACSRVIPEHPQRGPLPPPDLPA